ncbi:MAG: cryptochrome/photolyase family protein [Pseudomonadota bacterium]|jgi:deoxyribodipyrimidine photolyase-related protein|nr:cryptochrome/photolyase family protein [Pseudomonadota bacterium]
MTDTSSQAKPLRHLVLVLGDQLDAGAAAFDGCDPEHDALWMAEVQEESTHVWSAQQRIALFLSAMRHFAAARREAGWTVHYSTLDAAGNTGTLAGELGRTLRRVRPSSLRLTAPGDWRVLEALRAAAQAAAVPLELCTDRHFYVSVREFARHARGRRQLRMEYFYREQRRRHDVLMQDGAPVGGQWNFDADNREAFPASGPPAVPAAPTFTPDALTLEVMALVRRRFGAHPGTLEGFSWPVTPAQAHQALEAFIRDRLGQFGRWQDALWPGESGLWHAKLSAALNLKLLDPRTAVQAAETAWRDGAVPLPSAEGFIRQILGWREYVRGIYWTQMPQYAEHNAFAAEADLPGFYWTGEAPMPCLADALRQTLHGGYAHHIQRLMVIGLYALLLGVRPREIHHWFLAVYVDAVEWVELPNVLGMSQFADGGLMASKPYIASGQYIKRMSAGAYCRQCRFDPGERSGPRACPYTLLYWDFLLRHAPALEANPRTALQARNAARLSEGERTAIQRQADRWRAAPT